MNDLPLEIMQKIFLKLSVKELHKNKAVCKLWSSIISERYFRSEYSVRRNFNTLYIRSNQGGSILAENDPRVSLDFLREIKTQNICYNSYYVLASSNGLILCSNVHDPDPSLASVYLYVVCNPVTKQWLKLPSPPTCPALVLSGIICSESEDGSTRCKVVRIVRDKPDGVSRVVDMEIFDSATNQWSVLRRTLDIEISFSEIEYNVVEHKGVLYWPNSKSNSVLAFDPNHERCLLIPVGGGPSILDMVLGASRDHLYCCQMGVVGMRSPRFVCIIWRRDEFEGTHTWSVHRSLDLDVDLNHAHVALDNFRACNGASLKNNNILAIDPVDCNILISMQFQYEDSNSCFHCIDSYDVARRRPREVCSFPLSLNPERQSNMFVEPIWPTSLPKLPTSGSRLD